MDDNKLNRIVDKLMRNLQNTKIYISISLETALGSLNTRLHIPNYNVTNTEVDVFSYDILFLVHGNLVDNTFCMIIRYPAFFANLY